MKKINYIYILLGMIFVTLLMSSTSAYAWPNPNLLSTKHEVGGAYISAYKKDYLENPNTLRKYYATHDWVAESALEILYSTTSHPFLTKLWDINDPDNLRIWFLFGTELPDSWTISGDLRTKCGATFGRKDILTAGHNLLLFSPSGGYPTDDSAAQVANKIYSRIVKSFQEKDCQKAALYLGFLLHIVTDATYYGHLISGPSDHIPIYAHMTHVTYRTWEDVNGDRSSEFFDIDEALSTITLADLQSKGSYLSPYLATILAGSDTYYGKQGTPRYREAEWLLQNAPIAGNNPGDHKFWEDVDGYWNDYSQEDTWTNADRPTSGPVTGPAAYFNTLEHNLNMAIYYCAHTINYVINRAGYTDCGCSGENPPGGENPNPGENEGVQDKEGVRLAVDEFQSLFFLGAIGLASTLISLTLVNKMLSIIDKMIPVW